MKLDSSIGLARGTVKLVPYDQTWQAVFETEAKLLQHTLGVSAKHIQHVGSTAIPGILAKPIIDIAIPVDDLTIADEWADILAKIGYWDKGLEPTMPDRRFFAKGPENKRTVYLHIVTTKEYQKLITFRDALRTNPKLGQEYSDLKVKLAASLEDDRKQYTHLKNDFIQHVLQAKLA